MAKFSVFWVPWIRPWYWRIPYGVLEVLGYRVPFVGTRRWLWGAANAILDRHGPFAPGRGYWMMSRDASGQRCLVPNPGMPPLPE